jgi:hypothetical protein
VFTLLCSWALGPTDFVASKSQGGRPMHANFENWLSGIRCIKERERCQSEPNLKLTFNYSLLPCSASSSLLSLLCASSAHRPLLPPLLGALRVPTAPASS